MLIYMMGALNVSWEALIYIREVLFRIPEVIIYVRVERDNILEAHIACGRAF